MPDTLIKQLESKDIHARADVGRRLSKIGTPAQIPRLMEAAFDDVSPGVRLYSVGAAADILSRYRVGPRAAELDEAWRQDLLKSFHSQDPGVNAGMFSVIACLGLPKAARRLLVGVQDPRLDVRTGAIVGLYRYAISSAAADDTVVRDEAIKLLANDRVRPDAKAAIARLCGQCGWYEAQEALQRLLAREDQVVEAAEIALDRLAQGEKPESLLGVWVGFRADAGEILAEPIPRDFLVFADDVGAFFQKSLKTFRWTSHHGTNFTPVGTSTRTVRRMNIAPPDRHDEAPTLQWDGRTWYRAFPEHMSVFLDRFEADEELTDVQRQAMATVAAAGVDNEGPNRRIRARALLAGGLAQEALDSLTEALLNKKPTPEDQFYLGLARHDTGDTKGARTALKAFLRKAEPEDPRAAVAKALVG